MVLFLSVQHRFLEVFLIDFLLSFGNFKFTRYNQEYSAILTSANQEEQASVVNPNIQERT